MNKILLTFLLAAALLPVAGQKKVAAPLFDHIEPPFWWTSFRDRSLQILLYNSKVNITDYGVTLAYPGVTLTEVRKVENPHYLFLELTIDQDAKPGMLPFAVTLGKKKMSFAYELKGKFNLSPLPTITSADVVYLLMPDRFANGDVKNDSVPGYYEGVHRDNPNGRHGGDLKGVGDHLDYFADLGITGLWLNPVLENNQPHYSYHGYAITDLYKVDGRFGSNDQYKQLIDKAHAKGIKIIQDMVMNHIGNEHWLFKDLPEKSWVHRFPELTKSNFRGSAMSDPYVAKADALKMNSGWFDGHMPDLDQTNPNLATYLIQNSLWWIAYAGIDGIRMDTYPYPDKEFMAVWARRVLDEFPQFYLVGEVWINANTTSAYWQKGALNHDGYQSFLPSLTDFPLHGAIPSALNEKEGYDTGLARLYFLLSQDFIYPDPNDLLIFLDNHDLSRFSNSVDRDSARFKLGLTFLLTTRGIPQLYYGTEFQFDSDGGDHGSIRKDFPGGWPGDQANAFTASGRTREQNEIFDFTRRLLNWRKTNATFNGGKLVHYVPENNVYVYFRSKGNARVMVVLNGSEKEVSLSTSRFADDLAGTSQGMNVISGKTIADLSTLTLAPRSALVLELK